MTQILKILPIGDSITVGYTDPPNWSHPFNFGYRGVLFNLLDAAFPARFTFVGASPEPWDGRFGNPVSANTPPYPDLRLLGQDHHRGYAGWGTSSIAASVGAWLDADQPDVVLLMVGINDIDEHATDEPTDAESGLHDILETIIQRESAIQIIVAQISPYATSTPAIALYNVYIRTVLVPEFQNRGSRVSTVDQYAALLDVDGQIDPALFANGINHPNQQGYERMAHIWFDALAPRLSRESP